MHHYITAPELTDEYIATTWETLSLHVRPTTLLSCPCPALSERFQCDVTIAIEI